jgi:nitrile hydratase
MAHDHHHGGHNPEPESLPALRTRALESLLVEKGLLSSDLVDRLVEAYEHDIGPLNGARVVARAWVDPEYRARLLADGSAAITEMGFDGNRNPIQVVENTADVHNVVVCTLCSCYPWAVLGLPPTWYKSAPYRSRVVIEPRKVLAEFGLELDPSVEVRVWDSSAEQRYMVLPERPAGTESLTEEHLTALVTRDAMIGVAKVRVPTLAR